jgi:hypothetical protein
MTLNFPNGSRSYDARRNLVRFWGHDRAMEVAFLVEVDAFCTLSPRATDAEAVCLEAFDGARERIHASARKAYARSRERKDAYVLSAADF